ncbi:MAG: hypothetical protein ACI4J0_09660 [Huintestinicola sp.]|uniref:hypothetical protein n=1 Tax=Huintestinicola sp. TaxID=2981661 RepID=UPI003F11FCF9
MINLTKETLDRLYKKQKTLISSWWIASISSIVICNIFLWIFSYKIPDRSVRNIIICIVTLIPVIYILCTMRTLIPAGHGRILRRVFKVLQYDFMSDSTVDMLYRSIGEAAKYPEKVRLTGLLVTTYILRGQYNEALNLLYSVDRSGFDKYPDVGMLFYTDIIAIYCELEDFDSALRAYADGEEFIDAAAERNYSCCTAAFSAMISVEKARGNYRKALDLRLILNEYQNLFNSSTGASQQGTPLSRIIRGATFAETAELFYLCGDLDNAAKYLDIGGPMLSASPAETEIANKLSAKIREAMAKR